MKGFAIMTVAVLIVIGIGVGLVGGLRSGSSRGTVTGGLQLAGGLGASEPEPVPGRMTLVNESSGATFHVRTGARYSIAVPAGVYDVTAETFNGGGGASFPVRVRAGHRTVVDVSIPIP